MRAIGGAFPCFEQFRVFLNYSEHSNATQCTLYGTHTFDKSCVLWFGQKARQGTGGSAHRVIYTGLDAHALLVCYLDYSKLLS